MSTYDIQRSIIVAGVGRSGTTWLGKLLDSSPHVFYRHEPDNTQKFPWFRGIPSRLDAVSGNDRWREPFLSAVELAFRSHNADLLQKPFFRKSFLRQVPWWSMNVGLRLERTLRKQQSRSIRLPDWMFRSGVPLQCALKSVRSNMRLAWMHHQFPMIRIILVIRHPAGYLSSWLRAAREAGWAGFGARNRLDDTILPFSTIDASRFGSAYQTGSDFERELIYWIIANEAPLLALQGSPRAKIVIYEELARVPERVVRDIYRFCGLEVGRSTLRFLEDSTTTHRTGLHDVYKLSERVVEQWREDLDLKQVSLVREYLRETPLAKLWRESIDLG